MKNLVLIDGNSILNRAFYGIMNSKVLTTKERNSNTCCIWFFGNNV